MIGLDGSSHFPLRYHSLRAGMKSEVDIPWQEFPVCSGWPAAVTYVSRQRNR
jgi:hypothetical protein